MNQKIVVEDTIYIGKEETLVDSTGTKGVNLEDKFLVYVFTDFSIT